MAQRVVRMQQRGALPVLYRVFDVYNETKPAPGCVVISITQEEYTCLLMAESYLMQRASKPTKINSNNGLNLIATLAVSEDHQQLTPMSIGLSSTSGGRFSPGIEGGDLSFTSQVFEFSRERTYSDSSAVRNSPRTGLSSLTTSLSSTPDLSPRWMEHR
jgi:hypothetical protein